MALFYFIFVHLQGIIHRQGYSPVILPHRQWLPDIRAPCKGCCHPSISVQYTHKNHHKHVDTWTNKYAHIHTNNLPLNQILSFCFSDSKGGWGSGIVYASKVITISSGFGVTLHSSPTPHHSEGQRDFNHFIAATMALVNWWQPNPCRSVEWLLAAKCLISFSLQLLTACKWTNIKFWSSVCVFFSFFFNIMLYHTERPFYELKLC